MRHGGLHDSDVRRLLASTLFVYEAAEASETCGLESRGSREASDNHRLDLRFELLATVYNALDQEQTIGSYAHTEDCGGGDLGLATSYRRPRYFEAGIHFES